MKRLLILLVIIAVAVAIFVWGRPSEASISTNASLESLLVDEDFSAGIPPGWTVVDGGSGGLAAATWTTANPGGRSIP